MYQYSYNTKFGTIYIAEDCGEVVWLNFKPIKQVNAKEKETELIKKTHQELLEYFSGERKTFNIPIKLNGTAFQIKVWKALCQIPYGETVTYKDIATKIGQEKACRAVGMANNKNPICIIVPCHRVIGKNGSLTGYAGGLNIKEKLLNIEVNNPFSNRLT